VTLRRRSIWSQIKQNKAKTLSLFANGTRAAFAVTDATLIDLEISGMQTHIS